MSLVSILLFLDAALFIMLIVLILQEASWITLSGGLILAALSVLVALHIFSGLMLL